MLGNASYHTIPSPLPAARLERELFALRTWHLVRWAEDGGLRLASVTQQVPWHGPVFHSDRLPEALTSSGVYAMKADQRSRDGFDWLRGPSVWIWGWVGLYGRVMEHELGYRAEHAVIRRLRLGVAAYLHFAQAEAIETVVRELEQRYQCRVRFGGHEAGKAQRLLTYRGPRGSWQLPVPSLLTLHPPPPPTPIVPAPGAAAISTVANRGPAGSLRVLAAASASGRRRVSQVPRPKPGYSQDGLRFDDVVEAFRDAEQTAPAKWPLRRKDWWRIVALRPVYSRYVTPATSCWTRMRNGGPGTTPFYPYGVVVLAARRLGVKPALLITPNW